MAALHADRLRGGPAAQAEAEVERSAGPPAYAAVVGLASTGIVYWWGRPESAKAGGWLACDLGAAFWPSPGGAGRAGGCDWGCGGVIQYLFVSVRGPERLCVRFCARRRRPRDSIGGVLVVLEDG